MKMFTVSSDGELIPLSFRIVSAAGGKDVEIPYHYQFVVKPNLEKKCVDVELISPPGMHLNVLEDLGLKTDVKVLSEAIANAIRDSFPGFTIGEIVETPDYYEARQPKEADFIFEKDEDIEKALETLMQPEPEPQRPEVAEGPAYVPRPTTSAPSHPGSETAPGGQLPGGSGGGAVREPAAG